MKFSKLMLAAITAAAIMMGTGTAVSACPVDPEEIVSVPLSSISKYTKYNCYPNVGADFLISSRVIKKNLLVDYDDTLVIPKGKKLVLNKGAHINGTLYIEEGGYLAVRGGALLDCGAIICDGTISVRENAMLTTHEGSLFLVTETGKLKYSADSISLNGMADVACLGTLSCKYLSDVETDYLSTEPESVIVGNSGEYVSVNGKETFADYAYGIADYLIGYANNGDKIEYITLLMDNGSSFRYKAIGGKTTDICYVQVANLKGLAAEVLAWASNQKQA